MQYRVVEVLKKKYLGTHEYFKVFIYIQTVGIFLAMIFFGFDNQSNGNESKNK